MEQTQDWNNVVLAAGMAAVYNADDWQSSVDNPPVLEFFVVPA